MTAQPQERDSKLKSKLVSYFDSLAPKRDQWTARNSYYHRQLARIFSYFIPAGRSVLEIGAGTGQLLNALKPRRGVGVDFSPEMVGVAQKNFPHLEFHTQDAQELQLEEKFDYIALSDFTGFSRDVQRDLANLHQVCTRETRILISFHNFLWEPLLKFGEWLGLKARQPVQNWLTPADLQNLLELSGFEVVRKSSRLLLPIYVPLLSSFCNRLLVNLPIFRTLGLVHFLVARPRTVINSQNLKCSVIVPCRNERGNIEEAVQRTPQLGSHTELIFVEGNSTDGTAEEIRRVMEKYPNRDIKFLQQDGKGKGDAVRKGFSAAQGDILMILDADLTVDPEELPKFYDALVSGKGEMVHGSRLVYPMEKQAMRLLNIFGNKFFSLAFTYLLDQRFKDTLCGTKVLFRSDYEKLAAQRDYFGDFDPFGDFDLLFGAAKLNLKIIEIPIHYRERTYGSTNISRFRHGWLLLRMSVYAMVKMKFV